MKNKDKIYSVIKLSKIIRDILNKTNNKELIEQYKEALSDLSHILLYIYI